MSSGPRLSVSFVKLGNRLALTSQHMDIVNKALSEIVAKKGSDAALAKHAITRNMELAIRLLYTHLSEYLRFILAEMYAKKPLEIVGKFQGGQAALPFHEIVNLGTYEAVCQRMIDQVFRNLEGQRSTKILIEKILDRTGAKVNSEQLENAMLYMEIRHLIVHNSSVVDRKFKETYEHKLSYAVVGSKLPMSIGLARRAIASIRDLCRNIDSELVSKGYLDPHLEPAVSDDGQFHLSA